MSPTIVVAADPAGARNLIANPALRCAADGLPDGWTYWSPRPGIAHEHAVVSRAGAASLMLRARGFESYGHWSTRVDGIAPGRYYRFEAQHQSEQLPAQSGSVFAVLSWYGGTDGLRELQRDYVDRTEAAGNWWRVARTLQAPAGATAVRIELGLRRTAGGAVYWRDVRFTESPPPPARIMRVATTRLLPASPATMAANTRLLVDMLERVGPEKPDIVLLSENFSTRGVRLPVAEKAEPIPGPLTRALAGPARKHRMHVITTLLERDGDRLHNTAVLIDRDGAIAAKYHKVHLTIGEMENGLTPGNHYPVFATDVGRIGIVTCWDNWFSEPMRILRLNGAEVVFMPLAGDGDRGHWEVVWPARAIDNGVYLVTSSTVAESPSRIIDPTGAVVAETKEKSGFAVTDLDLNREWRLRYLSVGSGAGEARSLYLRERRPETYGPLLKDSAVRSAAEAGAR